jgi:hypothetical protein
MLHAKPIIVPATLLILVLICHILAPSAPAPPTGWSGTVTSPSTPGDPAHALLDALALHGWDTSANGGLGGIWWTWRTGSGTGTDFNAAGTPTPGIVAPDDDPLLDVALLDALWREHASAPGDPHLDTLRAALSRLVKHLAPYPQTLEEGAIALTLQDISRCSGDTWYADQAAALVARDVATLYHPAVGALYWVDDQHPAGWYRTAQTLELSAALVVEGGRTGHPEWVRDAAHAVAFIQAHAYLPQYRVFLSRLGNVALANGAANPDEAILRVGDDGIADDGGTISLGDIAREALALLTISQGTQDAALRSLALTLLTDELPSTNHLNLWDGIHGGYATSVVFPGSAVAHAGRPSAPTPITHPSDYAWLLRAEGEANTLAPGTFTGSITQMQQILTTHAIDPTGPGVFAAATPTWRPLPLAGGGTANWYDSLAMTLVALALLDASHPGLAA